MNIILINHYAGSPQLGMEFRPYYMAKHWIKNGHKVIIIGGTYSHLRKNQPQKGEDNIDGISYLWIPTRKYNSNGVSRFLSMLDFVRKLYKKRKYLKQFNADVVIASSTYPLDIYPAHRIAKDNKAKLVFEIHDLWPLSPMELGGMSKYHPFIILMQMAENYAYNKCDSCVSILPCVKEHVVNHGLDPQKLHLVPNGIIEEEWANKTILPQTHSTLIDKLKDEGYSLVCFAGSHGNANALHTLIDGVKNLKKDKVAAILVGSGLEKNKLQKYVSENNILNVYFLPSVEKSAIPTLLQKMDFLYIGLQKEALFRFGISPNKIFDYMMAKKPIIQSIEAGNDLTSEAKCGISIAAEDSKAVKEAILYLKSLPEEERNILGENGYNYVLTHNTYNVINKKFLNAIM